MEDDVDYGVYGIWESQEIFHSNDEYRDILACTCAFCRDLLFESLYEDDLKVVCQAKEIQLDNEGYCLSLGDLQLDNGNGSSMALKGGNRISRKHNRNI